MKNKKPSKSVLMRDIVERMNAGGPTDRDMWENGPYRYGQRVVLVKTLVTQRYFTLPDGSPHIQPMVESNPNKSPPVIVTVQDIGSSVNRLDNDPTNIYVGYRGRGSDEAQYGCQWNNFDGASNSPYSNWLRMVGDAKPLPKDYRDPMLGGENAGKPARDRTTGYEAYWTSENAAITWVNPETGEALPPLIEHNDYIRSIAPDLVLIRCPVFLDTSRPIDERLRHRAPYYATGSGCNACRIDEIVNSLEAVKSRLESLSAPDKPVVDEGFIQSLVDDLLSDKKLPDKKH